MTVLLVKAGGIEHVFSKRVLGLHESAQEVLACTDTHRTRYSVGLHHTGGKLSCGSTIYLYPLLAGLFQSFIGGSLCQVSPVFPPSSSHQIIGFPLNVAALCMAYGVCIMIKIGCSDLVVRVWRACIGGRVGKSKGQECCFERRYGS